MAAVVDSQLNLETGELAQIENENHNGSVDHPRKSTDGADVTADDIAINTVYCTANKAERALLLISPDEKEFDKITDLVKQRLEEGNGECIFNVGETREGDMGLNEQDFEASVATLESVAASVNAVCVPLRKRPVDNLITCQFLVRMKQPEGDFTEIR